MNFQCIVFRFHEGNREQVKKFIEEYEKVYGKELEKKAEARKYRKCRSSNTKFAKIKRTISRPFHRSNIEIHVRKWNKKRSSKKNRKFK